MIILDTFRIVEFNLNHEIDLFQIEDCRIRKLSTSLPAGTWYPPNWVSSCAYRKGTIGAGLYFLRVSWKTAPKYGSLDKCSSVILLVPQTF